MKERKKLDSVILKSKSDSSIFSTNSTTSVSSVVTSKRRPKLDPIIQYKASCGPRLLGVDAENELSIERLKTIEKGLVHQVKHAEVEKKYMEKKCNDYQRKMSEIEERYKNLEQEFLIYREHVKLKMSRVDHLETAVQNKNTELEKLVNDVHNARMEAQKEVHEQMQTLRSQLTASNKELEKYKWQCTNLGNENNTLNGLLADKENEVKSLQDQVENLNLKIIQVEKENCALEEERKKAVDKCEEMQANYFLVDRQIAILLKENGELDKDKAALAEQLSKLREDSSSAIPQSAFHSNDFDSGFDYSSFANANWDTQLM